MIETVSSLVPYAAHSYSIVPPPSVNAPCSSLALEESDLGERARGESGFFSSFSFKIQAQRVLGLVLREHRAVRVTSSF